MLATILWACLAAPQGAESRPAPAAAELLDLLDVARCGGARRTLPPAVTIAGSATISYTSDPHGAKEAGRASVACDGKQYYQIADYPNIGKLERGFDGKVTWELSAQTGARILGDAEAESVRRTLAFGPWPGWRALYRSAELGAEQTIDGRRCAGVKATSALGQTDVLWLDAETHLPLLVESMAPTPQGWASCRTHYSDWRSVDGFYYAHRTMRSIPGIESTIRVESVQHGAPDAARMETPAVIRALAEKETSRPASGPMMRIVELDAQPVASIRFKTNLADAGAQLAKALPEVWAHVKASGVKPAGPPFARYHAVGIDELDLEAGVPTEKAIEPKGRVQAGSLPKSRVAATSYYGEYQGLFAAHLKLDAWIREQGLEKNGPAWDVFATDPEKEPDASKWQTILIAPVK